MNEDIKCFLKETEFCDFAHPDIQEIAYKITDSYTNNRDKAVSLFYWVRDNILYRVGNWQKKASETLVEKEGACTNKANLLVALLRANNIPAGYGIMKVDGQRYFGPIAIPMLRKFIGKISTHIYVSVYLNNKWIKCDPSDDKELCESTYYFNPPSKLVEWDGIQNAMLNVDEKHILKDSCPIANIDPWMHKRPRHARGIPLEVANIFIRFARKNKQKVTNTKDLEVLFKKWLRVNCPLYFYSFSIISWYKIFKSNSKRSCNDTIENN
ncbi:transglutaminase family protein [Patescibacteria group bacterium]|nr:transglutaminase family protein [Patescibacteria group bacterium]